MIGEGQDIATGTVPPSLLYNLLHLPSRKRCPIPSKRQSLLSILPSPREDTSKRREALRGLIHCQPAVSFIRTVLAIQMYVLVEGTPFNLSFGVKCLSFVSRFGSTWSISLKIGRNVV